MHSLEFLEQVGTFGGQVMSLAGIGRKIKQKPWKKSRLGNVFPAAMSNGFFRIASRGTEPIERSVGWRPLPRENRSKVNPIKRSSRGRRDLRRGKNRRCEVHGNRRL